MIKMIAGVFGRHVNGLVKPMDKHSEAFEVSAEQEAQLVKLGLAVYVSNGEPIGFDETPEDIPEGVTGIPEYSTENTAAELREIGKLCGLTFKVGMTKAEMVAALDKHIEEHTVDGVEVTEDDDAPTFDASEAVQ